MITFEAKTSAFRNNVQVRRGTRIVKTPSKHIRLYDKPNSKTYRRKKVPTHSMEVGSPSNEYAWKKERLTEKRTREFSTLVMFRVL